MRIKYKILIVSLIFLAIRQLNIIFLVLENGIENLFQLLPLYIIDFSVVIASLSLYGWIQKKEGKTNCLNLDV